MLWRWFLHRFVLGLIGIIILIPVTLYATWKKLNKLPLGLDKVFGCEEDGWNGNGIDPNNPRQFWKPDDWHNIHEDRNGNPTGTQGWWADYLKIDWGKQYFLKRWWLGYRWCAWRNMCWNLRLQDWFSDSIHYDDIKVTKLKDTVPIHCEWVNKEGKKRFIKQKKLFGILFEYGWEFKPEIFNPEKPEYERVRKHGYTRMWKYRKFSIPSIRKR